MEAANREVALVAAIWNGHFPTIEELLLGITVAPPDHPTKVKISSGASSEFRCLFPHRDITIPISQAN
jgi:hypothetical protein